jgi:pilus assembly protein Flp/PilA
MKLPEPLQQLVDILAQSDGQGMVEYALVLVLIAVVVIAILIVVGNQVQNVFCNITGAIGA